MKKMSWECGNKLKLKIVSLTQCHTYLTLMASKVYIIRESQNNLEKSHNFFSRYFVSSKSAQLEDFSKLLWPSQKIWTVLQLNKYETAPYFFYWTKTWHIVISWFLCSHLFRLLHTLRWFDKKIFGKFVKLSFLK